MIKLGKLNNEVILKVIRQFVLVLAFLCIMSIAGFDMRQAHQLIFSLISIALFMFLVDNIWLTLFAWWTIFLYAFFGCNFGDLYVTNILYGSILYYLVKISYKKEHIDFFLDGILWLCFLNISYQIVQVLGYDFLYTAGGTPIGFMGNHSITTIFFALCVPILARRSMLLALLLFIPAKLSGGSTGLLACLIGYLWMMSFKVKRWMFVLTILLLVLVGGAYLATHKIEKGWTDRLVLWKMSLQDANFHPITGWGLDSYRNYTDKKQFVYKNEPVKEGNHISINGWDNPHNLYISLLFEWGIIAIILLIGYIRQCGLLFLKAVKTPNLYALTGVLIVFFFVNIAWFPMFLARMVVILVPLMALFEQEAKLG